MQKFRMRNVALLGAGLLASVAMIACSDDDDDDTMGDLTPATGVETPATVGQTPANGSPAAGESPSGDGATMVVTLDEVQGSGVSGEALVEAGDTETVLTLTLAEPGWEGEAEVIEGTCGDAEEADAVSSADVDGAGTATLDVSVDDLSAGGHSLVLLAEGDVVACGTIS